MNKICTSIDQSKKLIELGIDVNTADLIYQPIMDIDSMSNVGFAKIPLCFSFNEIKECNIQYLPAWSLSALLELIPSNVFLYSRLVKWDNSYYIEQREMLYNNPVDAAFEMIIWLKENGKI